MLPVTIGLFGKDAPEAVKIFKQLCASELMAPCPSDIDLSQELMERGKQSKKASLRGCQGSEALPVTYAYSQVWAVHNPNLTLTLTLTLTPPPNPNPTP